MTVTLTNGNPDTLDIMNAPATVIMTSTIATPANRVECTPCSGIPNACLYLQRRIYY